MTSIIIGKQPTFKTNHRVAEKTTVPGAPASGKGKEPDGGNAIRPRYPEKYPLVY